MTASDPKKPRRRSHDLEAPYVPGDTIPAAEAVERQGETVWALFSELSKAQDQPFAPTVIGSTSPDPTKSGPSWAQTQVAAGRLPRRRPVDPPLFTLEAAMLVARKNNRVCPRPERWDEFTALLPARQTPAGLQQPPAGATGAAWDAASPLAKRLCFREQLEWADREGAMENAMAFLQALPEEEWLHMGE